MGNLLKSAVDGKRKPTSPDADKGGRASKLELDKDLPNKLRQAILMGAPVLTAAALYDISYEAMRQWVMKGKENPDSEFGHLIQVLQKAIAEWEIRDLSVLEAHAVGRPARYLQEPVKDANGEVIFHDGKPLMQYVRDDKGNPILEASEIKSDWRAAMERLARRKPRTWAQKLNIDMDAILSFTNDEKTINPVEALTFEQRIARAVKELEDEV